MSSRDDVAARVPVESRVVLTLIVLVAAGAAGARGRAPDLESFIACRASAQAYNAFALDFASHAERAREWGWKKVKIEGALLDVYELGRPITVHGHETTRVAFSGSGVVALLAKPAAAELARTLGLSAVHRGPTSEVWGKLVRSDVDRAGSVSVKTRVEISVSSSESFPGVTLAGCSYTTEVE